MDIFDKFIKLDKIETEIEQSNTRVYYVDFQQSELIGIERIAWSTKKIYKMHKEHTKVKRINDKLKKLRLAS